MKRVTALVFRRRFGRVLDEVVRTRQPVTITRANRPLVVVVPAEGYEGGEGAERAARLRVAAERVAEWRARHASQLRGIDPVALVRKDRDGR